MLNKYNHLLFLFTKEYHFQTNIVCCTWPNLEYIKIPLLQICRQYTPDSILKIDGRTSALQSGVLSLATAKSWIISEKQAWQP